MKIVCSAVFVILGAWGAFPYFMTPPMETKDAFPWLIGILSAASLFAAGYVAGSDR